MRTKRRKIGDKAEIQNVRIDSERFEVEGHGHDLFWIVDPQPADRPANTIGVNCGRLHNVYLPRNTIVTVMVLDAAKHKGPND